MCCCAQPVAPLASRGGGQHLPCGPLGLRSRGHPQAPPRPAPCLAPACSLVPLPRPPRAPEPRGACLFRTPKCPGITEHPVTLGSPVEQSRYGPQQRQGGLAFLPGQPPESGRWQPNASLVSTATAAQAHSGETPPVRTPGAGPTTAPPRRVRGSRGGAARGS